MRTKFILYVSAGSYWYVGFTDPKGVDRLLPTKRKWFGRKWTINNCPKLHAKKNIFTISDGNEEDLTPQEAQEWMIRHHQNVETYLNKLNKGQL